MQRNWRIYVGAEVPGTATSADGNSSTRELLDTAFTRRAHATLRAAPQAVRQHPSAAPSPILRWLLQMEQQVKRNDSGTPHTPSPPSHDNMEHDAGPSSAETGTAKEADGSMVIAGGSSGSRATAVPGQTLATSTLARRGVGPKDPLLKRILKKQQQQQQQTSTAISSAPAAGAASTQSVAASGVTVLPSHWTQHLYSAMTATSWRVFRQQLGITIELVAPAKVSSTVTGEGADKAESKSLSYEALPAADTLPAIRCWEEAQLPLSLGRCVATTYALPTAVQAQCVPLALLTTPASIHRGEHQQQQRQPPKPTASSTKTAPSTATASSLGMDVLAVAETGSGKTAAYLVPLLYHVLCRAPKLLGHPDRISLGPLSLVIVPTRELAEQVTMSLLLLCGQAGGGASTAAASSASAAATSTVRLMDIVTWETEENDALLSSPASAAPAPRHSTSAQRDGAERNCLSEFHVVKVVGGESREAQYNALAHGAHCVVGTVGQLQALLEDRLLSLGNTQFVVMDEADRMIDEQQDEKLISVLERCPTPRQTLMFTATLSTACATVAKRYLAATGYYLVRTPYRCASIRQSFEMMSTTSTTSTSAAEDAVRAATVGAAISAKSQHPQQQQQQRRLHPSIHPQKFARLVSWLVYGTGPIIVFANEKMTCDILFDELRAEAEHLDAQQEYFTLTDLLGPPPDGLVFREGNEGDTMAGRPPSAASTTSMTGTRAAAPSSVSGRRSPSLLNLTSVAVVHSELSQGERRSLVAQFQRRQRQVLLTTDLLARGLDVAGVTLVVNYDVPWSATTAAADAVTLYIHRIGRTGRAGSTGVAVTFIALPAVMVQRAEDVVKDSAASAHALPGNTDRRRSDVSTASQRWARTTAAGDEDDPMSVVGELFDGDIDNVWVTSASVAAAATADGSSTGTRGRKRPRYASDSEEGAEEGDMTTHRDSGDDDGDGAVEDGDRRRDGKLGKVHTGFSNDVEVLRPLWSFLTQCAEGEGCKDGAAALLHGTYAKISVPPALACIMAQLSTTSQFGHITL